MYQERKYRDWMGVEGLVKTLVSVGETDLLILAPFDVSEEVKGLIREVRRDIEDYIQRDGEFLTALEPVAVKADAPQVVKEMTEAGRIFGVGPMAAVAGAVAEYVGRGLVQKCGQVIVENGGDIFAHYGRPLTMTLYAGEHSPFTGKLKFRVAADTKPLGICTSSGTVGHSYSRGKADAVCIISGSAVLADAAATAICNTIQKEDDVGRAVEDASNYDSIMGILVAMNDRLGVWGEVEII